MILAQILHVTFFVLYVPILRIIKPSDNLRKTFFGLCNNQIRTLLNERVEKLEQVLNAIIRSEGKKQILVGSDGSSNEHIEDYKKLILKLRKEGNDIMLGVFPSKGKNKIQSKLHTLAKYEIIVNVDSDVMVWNKTFVRLLAPFHDKRVGITNSKIDIVPSKKILDKYYRVLYLCANQSGRRQQSGPYCSH